MFIIFFFSRCLHFSCHRGVDKCLNRSLCEENLNVLLPAKPPFYPSQFQNCAVVGNSGDLLKTEFGKEIDSHDAVIRDNEAPVNEVTNFLDASYSCNSFVPRSFFWSTGLYCHVHFFVVHIYVHLVVC